MEKLFPIEGRVKVISEKAGEQKIAAGLQKLKRKNWFKIAGT